MHRSPNSAPFHGRTATSFPGTNHNMPRQGKQKPYEKTDKRTQELPMPTAKKSASPIERPEGNVQETSVTSHTTSSQQPAVHADKLLGSAQTSIEAKQAEHSRHLSLTAPAPSNNLRNSSPAPPSQTIGSQPWTDALVSTFRHRWASTNMARPPRPPTWSPATV